MKFHKLSIENLNSLYGEHSIDFDDHLSKAPLFLIMGPIGAGKSTILDAICLALFGTTPRQRHVSSIPTVAEQVMSRGTGFAQIILEFSRLDPEKGRLHYRAQWRCQRAHQRANGKIQSPRRSLEIFINDDWDPIVSNEHRSTFYDDVFKEALAGMTLDDFLRSVLLAQGDFTAFLKADKSAKAAILQHLTGTEQYERIGKRAMNRWIAAKRDVDNLEQQLGVIPGLSDDDFQALKQSAQDLSETASRQEETVHAARTHVLWLENLQKLKAANQNAAQNLQAAQHTRELRADDFRRADLAQRAQRPADLLKQSQELAANITTLNTKIRTHVKEEKLLQKQQIEADKSLDEKQKALEAAQKEWDAHQKPIQEARALYERLHAAKRSNDLASARYKTAQNQLHTTKTELSTHQESLNKAIDDTANAQNALDELAAFQELPQLLSGLSAQVQNLRSLTAEAQTSAQNAAQKNDDLQALQATLEQQKQALEPATKALEPSQRALDDANQTLKTILQGAEDSQTRRRSLQEERESIAQAQRDVADAQRLLPDWLRANKSLQKTTDELKTSEEKLNTIAQKSEELRKDIQAAQELLQARQQLWEAQNDIFRLASERKKLRPQQPCPVCGSLDHPFLDKKFDDTSLQARLEDAQSALNDAQSALKELEDRQSILIRDQAVKESQQTTLLRQKEEHEESAETLKASLTLVANKLETPFDPAEPQRLAAQLERKEKELSDELSENTRTTDALNNAEQDQRQAQDAFQRQNQALNDLLAELKLAKSNLENAKRSLEEATTRANSAQKTLSTAREELTDAFTQAGISVDSTDDQNLEQALEKARETALRYKKAAQFLADAKTTEAQKKQAFIELKALLPDREKAFKEAQSELTEAQNLVDSLLKDTQNALGGETPDALEKRLNDTRITAQKNYDDAREALHQIQKELSQLQVILQSTRTNHEELQQKQEILLQELQEALSTAGFTDISALQAAILPEETLQSLKDELQTITDRLNETQTLAKSAEEDLAQHLNERPDDLPQDLNQIELTSFQQALKSAEETLSTIREELGALRNKIKTEDERRQQTSMLQDQLTTAQETLRRWDVIQKLIGQRGGERFKEFAQALNLERIVYHANQHLIRLHERYRLAVHFDDSNHPTLDFEIIDAYRNNIRRPISTLSGGETFLVSLALALALADFRQIHMPVETLLLDEGFGTLDQESLADAIAVLNSLHNRDHRQVGIISHVEQLHEQIEHRIHVQPQGGGRSIIELT